MDNKVVNDLPMCYALLDDSANSIIPLFEIAEKNIFTKIDYSLLSSYCPLWMIDAGCSSESIWSKDKFENYRGRIKSRTVNRILYYQDVNHLIGSLQDRFNMAKGALNDVFQVLTYPLTGKGSYVTAIRNSNLKVSTLLSELFAIYIYLCSSMDILTKVIIELEHIKDIMYDKYPKLKCEGKNYNSAYPFTKKYKGKNIFTKNGCISEIQDIRNRIIHDGGFDYSQWIYDCITKQGAVEHVIFLPDVKDGHIEKSINRRSFYSQGRTANEILLKHIIDYCGLFINTVRQACKLYDSHISPNSSLTERYISYVSTQLSKLK